MNNQMVKLAKFTNRTIACNSDAIKKRTIYLSKLDYSVSGHKFPDYHESLPIFTIILTLHDGNINFIQESLSSVLHQTYANTEVIIIDHGTTGNVRTLIVECHNTHKKTKLIRTDINLPKFGSDTEEFLYPVVNLWNAGLFCSQGDFIYFLSYDDKLSLDYAERMVGLFKNNPKCCSAAPLVVSINEKSEINEKFSEELRRNNCRSEYSNGVDLARSYMEGTNMISFPGGLLAQRSKIVLECGGFDSVNDLSQLFKFAINGDSGFDPKAKLYWRHHQEQTNKQLTKSGSIYYKTYSNFSLNFNIYELHRRVAGRDFADAFQAYIMKLASTEAIGSFRDSYKYYGLGSGCKALARIFKECSYKEIILCLFYLARDFPRMYINNHMPDNVLKQLRTLKNRAPRLRMPI